MAPNQNTLEKTMASKLTIVSHDDQTPLQETIRSSHEIPSPHESSPEIKTMASDQNPSYINKSENKARTSDDQVKIPKIEIRKENGKEELEPGSESWLQIRAQVWQALQSHGCFEVAAAELFPVERRDDFFSALKELFALPVEVKMRNNYGLPNHNYLPRLPTYPFHESMGIKDASNPESVHSFTSIMWPHGHPSFSNSLSWMTVRAAKLEHMLRRMVLESLGVDKYYQEHINSSFHLLRVMRYRVNQDTTEDKNEDEEELQVFPTHTDKLVLTLLWDNTASGLQIQTKDGQWLHPFTSPDSILVLAGESLLAWSNGRVHTPEHQVVMRRKDERYSAAMFSLHKPGYIVRAPDELVDDEHPLLFGPFETIDYLNFHLTPAGVAASATKSAMAVFCGIPPAPST